VGDHPKFWLMDSLKIPEKGVQKQIGFRTRIAVNNMRSLQKTRKTSESECYNNQVSYPIECVMKRALLVIDVQNEYFTGLFPITHPSNSLGHILDAMHMASQHGIPIVIIQHTEPIDDTPCFKRGSHEWELLPEIAKQPHDLLIEKTWPGSFTDTALETWLKQHDIDTVAIAGYMTQMCCDTTARQAIHRGFAVEFLSDATGTLAFENDAGSITAEELHRAILVTQSSFGSKVITTADWINSLKELAPVP
jgi:nicotinamidase-related amidase